MNDAASAKQQIVEKIKSSSNILVTVSTNPTVDELSAALGLTILLNKLKKHATAVVSGVLPPAIDFLEPGKTFENTVDSLRDFIIALDKEKADHLRYKVEGDVVKIFITPYRTTITSDDLDFSQGDYNVELVLALGVKNQEHLDVALAAHGRILHDATVATFSLSESSELGSIDWQDSAASSLSEMLVGLSEALKTDKTLLDEQIATAFLTGIVAATDRFSNKLTSSRVMTMAAQLMAAGANQQLIAAKLEDARAISQSGSSSADDHNSDGTTDLSEGESTKLDKIDQAARQATAEEASKAKNDGDLVVDHIVGPIEPAPAEVAPDFSAEQALAEELSAAQMASSASKTLSVADLQADLANASQDINQAAEPTLVDTPVAPVAEVAIPETHPDVSQPVYEEAVAPSFGGTLNATTETAAADKRLEEESDRNKSILHHSSGQYMANSQAPTMQSPINGVGTDTEDATIDPFAENASPSDLSGDTQPTAYAADIGPIPDFSLPAPQSQPSPFAPTLADIDNQNRATNPEHQDAMAAVDAAFSSSPIGPVGTPQFGNELPPPLPMPDFSSLPPMPPQLFDQSAAPNQSTAGLPPEHIGDIFGSDPTVQSAPPNNDPGQFRIPGQ